ncbi:MAG TPA: hypothetical protein VG034_06820 [Acidimicrobiia bacterium]|nr:hypothetical protein [Acidimicrobiia bacterium]
MIPSLPLTTRFRRRLAAATAVAVTAFLPLAMPAAPTAQAADGSARAAAANGYWMVASDGGIFSFGDAKFYGSTGNIKLNQPIVGIAATPSGAGYWMVATDGGIFSFGDAKFYGSTGNIKLNKPIVGMAATPSGKGYWLVASDGGVFSFGDAKFYGSTGNIKLNKPIVGMASSPTGNGYWFVASDGGIFAFGDAKFYGSTGNIALAKPITAMAATPSGKGYWFTANDGGIFAFGDARFFGAAPNIPATGPRSVTAMVPTPDGAGYWLGSATGELLAFGNAADLGGLSGALAKPIVGMTAVPPNATGVPGPTGPGNTGTTSPTTVVTQPPYSGPMRFSSTALHSWGTPADPDKGRINQGGTTVYPYSQKVDAIVEIGNRVYIGGEFKDLHQNNDNKNPTMSGIPLAYVAELDTDGNAVPGSAFNANVRLDGPVRSLVRSPDGQRLYIGGEFRHVNGQNRPYIVAINPATGQIDESFGPPAPDKYVNAMVLFGSRLYVAGAFENLNGTPRYQLVALDLSGSPDGNFVPPPRYDGKFVGHTGRPVEDPLAADPTTPDPKGTIETMLVTPDGKTLMVGGSFLYFGFDNTTDPKHKHSGLIAVDIATGGLCGQPGVPCTWQPEQSSGRPMFGMAAYPGDPHSIGVNASQMIYTSSGGAGGRVIAWTPGGKKTQLWRGNTDGDAMSVVATHDRVYVVGHFDHTVADPNDPCLQIDPNTGGVHCDAGTPNRHLAAFEAQGDIAGGKGWSLLDPSFTAQADTSEGPYVVALGANRMYVGGNFTDVASTPVSTGGLRVRQPGFAAYPPL